MNTPILDKAAAEDLGIYRTTDYAQSLERFRKFFVAEGRMRLAPEAIGEVVSIALTVAKPKVLYTVVKQKFKHWTLPMLLPRRVLDRLIGKQIGLLPSA